VRAPRTILTASAAVALGAGVLLPTAAEAHVAAGSVTCTEARIDYTKFPAGARTAGWTLRVDDVPAQSGFFAFQGPAATLVVPLAVTGTHTLSLVTGWQIPGESMPPHEVARATVTCGAPSSQPGTPPAPPPAPPPPARPPAPAPAPPPVAAPAGAVAPAVTRPARRRPQRCLLPALRARIHGPLLTEAGSRATVTIRVRNTSRRPARRVEARYRIPSGFSLIDASRPYRMSRGAALLRLGNLGAGRRLTVRVALRADRTEAGLKRTRVRVSGRGTLSRTRRTAPASCARTASATGRLRVLPVAARLAPAVTG
jgi:hypothetical protein